MKIVVVKGSEESCNWQEKVSSILSEISQRTGDDIQWLDIGQAWDILRQEGNGWDVAVVELPDSTLSENPKSWITSDWIVPDWRGASHGVFAVSATNHARVLVCSHSQVPNGIREQLEQNGATIVRLDELAAFHVEQVRRNSRRARVLDVVPTIGWMKVYHGGDLPEQFEIPEDISALMNDEVRQTRIQAEILAAAFRVFGGHDFHGVETLFVAMQTARYLARLEIEGKSYEMTLAVGKQRTMQDNLIELNHPLTIGLQSSSLPHLEEICELAQGPDTCIGIDGPSGLITGIFRILSDGDLGRISRLKSTAENFNVLLLHLSGNGTVELVGPNGVICEHNGSEWQWWKLRSFKMELRSFVTDSIGLNVLLEALDHLSLRRLSSIVAVGDQEFRYGAGSVKLKRLRCSLKFPSNPKLATLTPMSVASMLRPDGAHLIFLNKQSEALEIEGIAMNVVQEHSDSATTPHARGTGRKAAADLSAAYPDAVVCKISASGGVVKVYQGGQKMSETY